MTGRPRLLMLHLLGRCNLECVHCYMEGSPRRRDRLPLDAVLGAVADGVTLGIDDLVVTGGEPLLYPGLDRVLEAAAAHEQLHVRLCTNGTLLNARRAARLARYGVSMNVSIDGRPDYHDRFRGRVGAFAESERGIRAAVDAGIQVTVISTISQDNLDAVEFLAGWAAGLGAEQFLAQPLLQLGRGEGIADRCLSFTQLNRLILQLTDLANQPEHPDLTCQVIGARKRFFLDHPCGAFVCNGDGCHRGIDREVKKLVVREDGTVLPEVPNLHPRYALGNLHDDRLADLLPRYFDDGYDRFDELCRSAYAEVLPAWDCVIVPWEQILAERSRSWSPIEGAQRPATAVAGCGGARYGAVDPVAVG